MVPGISEQMTEVREQQSERLPDLPFFASDICPLKT